MWNIYRKSLTFYKKSLEKKKIKHYSCKAVKKKYDKILVNPISNEGDEKCPASYGFLYIFQTIYKINLKFSVLV